MQHESPGSFQGTCSLGKQELCSARPSGALSLPRGQSPKGPSPPCPPRPAAPAPQAGPPPNAGPSCLRCPAAASAAHHGLLELVGLDAAHEEGLAGAQRAHQQLQRPLELAAQCGRALPGLGALWGVDHGDGRGRPAPLQPSGRDRDGRDEGAEVNGSGLRKSRPGKRESHVGFPVTRLVWAGAWTPDASPLGEPPQPRGAQERRARDWELWLPPWC